MNMIKNIYCIFVDSEKEHGRFELESLCKYGTEGELLHVIKNICMEVKYAWQLMDVQWIVSKEYDKDVWCAFDCLIIYG